MRISKLLFTGTYPYGKKIKKMQKNERRFEMAEKWMNGNKVNWKPATRRHAQGIRNYKPNYLFKDSDKDGVANVFDCKPHNKRRQDVIAPFAGNMPVSDMWGRMENARRNREFLRAQELALEEARRLNNAQFTVVDRTKTELVYINEGGKDRSGNTYTTDTTGKKIVLQKDKSLQEQGLGANTDWNNMKKSSGYTLNGKPATVTIREIKQPSLLSKAVLVGKIVRVAPKALVGSLFRKK